MSKHATELAGEIDVYDFDKTIYEGDSSLDFYLFCIRKKPSLLAYLPYQLWHLILFAIKLEPRTNFKGHFFVFLRGLDETPKYVDHFWSNNFRRIKRWYLGLDHSRDVIVSASPEFLLQPAFAKLGAHALIATKMNPKTGEIDGENCRGEEKILRLRKVLGEPKIRKAYGDSRADMPILALAKEAYIVKGDKITRLKT